MTCINNGKWYTTNFLFQSTGMCYYNILCVGIEGNMILLIVF